MICLKNLYRLDIILLIKVQSSDYYGGIIEMKKKKYNKMERVLLVATLSIIAVFVTGFLTEAIYNIVNCGGEKLESFKFYS